MLNRREDWQQAFGSPSPAFDARIRQTLNQLEEENRMKKTSIRTAILVVALILALTGVVYAATAGWNIGDYFNNRYGDNANVPQGFESGYDRDYAQETDGLSFRIRDAYVDGDRLNAIVEISRADGKPALIRGSDCMEDDLIGFLYLDMKEDQRTVAQYAKGKNLPLHWAGTDFAQDGRVTTGTADFWMEGEDRLAYFVTAEDVESENGQAAFQWIVYSYGQGGTLNKKSMEIVLPVEEQTTWTVPVNQTLKELPVVLDELRLMQGRMGLRIEYRWHVEESLGMPEKAEALKRNDLNLWFRAVDPITWQELPGGATLTGSVDSMDDIHYVQKGSSIDASAVSDVIHIQPYDAWEKQTYETLTVTVR